MWSKLTKNFAVCMYMQTFVENKTKHSIYRDMRRSFQHYNVAPKHTHIFINSSMQNEKHRCLCSLVNLCRCATRCVVNCNGYQRTVLLLVYGIAQLLALGFWPQRGSVARIGGPTLIFKYMMSIRLEWTASVNSHEGIKHFF